MENTLVQQSVSKPTVPSRSRPTPACSYLSQFVGSFLASLEAAGVPVEDVRAVIDSGAAHADLEADYRDKEVLMVQGSPTFILNDGRQKLYGNVGYRVIEANINELLRSPAAGAASWC